MFRRAFGRWLHLSAARGRVGMAALVLLAALGGPAPAQEQEQEQEGEGLVTSHGLSIFGDLKYPAEFEHFDYVNPEAPKGGVYHTWDLGSYDSLTPFTEKGNAAEGAWGVFDSLMVGTLDTLDQMYGLIAESVTYPEDKSWVSFRMRPEARFSDGSPLTADDVVFTFDAMQNKGQLRYRAYFGEIEKVEALGPHEVKFTFAEGAAVRDLLPLVAGTSIFSKAYYQDRDFSQSSMDPPLGSGPYQVERAEAGRYVIYRRDEDYWAKDLPVNVGQNNFERLRMDYYADQSSAFEAFKAGEYTFRGETNADRWRTGYDFPARTSGQVVTAEIPARTVPYAGGLFFNLRREAFQDPKVRQAIETLFNFEWINATLFHGAEARAASYWERSDMRAEGPTPPEEQAVLEPLLADLPPGLDDILEAPAAVPFTGESAQRDRARQRRAMALFEEAGYSQEGGRLVGPDGRQLTLEMMYASPDAEQYLSPFAQMLDSIGIDASLRFVDSAQWRERAETYDFDSVHVFLPMSSTPGNELRDAFGSAYANVGGSLNVSGVSSPGIDKLISLIETAETREELNVRVRAMDRVLRAMHLRIPYWVRPDVWIAYYDYYRHPEPLPDYGLGVASIWWADTERYDELKAAGAIR
jgi:microcin C transport system substrate-binding protein